MSGCVVVCSASALTKEKTNVCTYVCMYVCHVIRTKKKKSRILSYKERKRKEKNKNEKKNEKKRRKKRNSSFQVKLFYKIYDPKQFLNTFMHHVAGTAAKPHAVNPRKIARVTSPSPRLSGKKDFPKKSKTKTKTKSRYRYINKSEANE